MNSHGQLASRPRFLTAEWRSLVMLNYTVDPAILAPYVPRGVELDLWQSEAIVSMVGFLFLETRLLGVPLPFHCDFEEVNLRFYVRRRVGDEWRRGVTFIRELVPRRAIAWTARLVYNEPYLALPMRHRIADGEYEFSWKFAHAWHRLGATVRGEPLPIAPGSEQDFIFEHYWGYTRQRDGGTVEYEVEHPRWRTWTAERSWLDCDAPALYGESFTAPLAHPPHSAFVAEGSPVCVRRAVLIH
jgi:uncharacterized protein YqjF (DUF2071 family)